MLLGVIAGFTGGAFNTLMQSAWMNFAFAALFTFFALSMLGFYELSLLQDEVHTLDQHSARMQGLSGTLLMGGLAGLVISPCVGPLVFTLLLQVADTLAAKASHLSALGESLGFWDKFVIALQGGFLMAGFGAGVAIPFFLVSIVKFKTLPKAGHWLTKIKVGFGAVILYVAFTYLEKAMGVLGVPSATTTTLALGLLIVLFAVVYCNVLTVLPGEAQPQQKLQHYFGVISLVVGGWLLVTSLGRLPIATIHSSPLTEGSAATACSEPAVSVQRPNEIDAGITWYRDFAAAQQAARATHKPMFIDFYASWCANCIAFKSETARNDALNLALREHAIAVKLVEGEADFEAFRNNPEHRSLKIGLPYFAILNHESTLTWSGSDHTAAQAMINRLEQLYASVLD